MKCKINASCQVPFLAHCFVFNPVCKKLKHVRKRQIRKLFCRVSDFVQKSWRFLLILQVFAESAFSVSHEEALRTIHTRLSPAFRNWPRCRHGYWDLAAPLRRGRNSLYPVRSHPDRCPRWCRKARLFCPSSQRHPAPWTWTSAWCPTSWDNPG